KTILFHIQKRYTFALPGELAHLVERLHGMQEVTGSIPVFSTALRGPQQCGPFFIYRDIANSG
ncbi:MAG: hypothetical protein RL282_795, partial [Bacteroidota bacterium]